MLRGTLLLLLVTPFFAASPAPSTAIMPSTAVALRLTAGVGGVACTPEGEASTDSTSGVQGVERRRPEYKTISVELFRSLLADQGPGNAWGLSQTFVEPGELRLFFVTPPSDDQAKREIVDYYRQRSATGLHIDEYGVISVSWADAQLHGVPDLQPDQSFFDSVVEFGHRVLQNLDLEDWPDHPYKVTFACSTDG